MPRQLSEAEFSAIEQRIFEQLPKGLSEAEFTRAFEPRFAAAIAEAEQTAPQPEGSAIGRFVGGAAEYLNPVTAVGNLAHAVRHPIDTLTGQAAAMGAQLQQVPGLVKEGRLAEASGRALAGALPFVGPAAAKAGEAIASGDVAGGLGQAVGLLVPMAAGEAIRATAKGPNVSKAAMLTREAEQQVAGKVLGPGNPAYRGKAAALAPEMLARKLSGGRAELAQAAEEGMADAAAKLDQAIQDAGGVKAPVPPVEIIQRLKGRIADLQDSNGKPLSDQAAIRITALQDRMTQIQSLSKKGAPPTFEDLRKVRDENYRIADEARGYARMGNPALSDTGWAARETGSAIREAFAKRSPATAAANADYTFWKNLSDVLDPVLGRPKSTALPTGVTGGTRVSAAMTGALVSPKLAFVMATVVPWVRDHLHTPAWQLADAQSKMRLADAVKRGDIGLMRSAIAKMSRAGSAANVMQPPVSTLAGPGAMPASSTESSSR